MPQHPALAALHQRWTGFLDKVRARIGEIEAEARGTYQQAIARDPLDVTAITRMSTELDQRMRAMREKVEDAWTKLDGELDGIDAPPREGGAFRGANLALGRALEHEIDRRRETMQIAGEAEVARALQPMIAREAAAPVACSGCGAPLARPAWHRPVEIACPHCRAVTTALPGPAAHVYVDGIGARALAREASLPAWYALLDAELAWHRLRHKAPEDVQWFEQANRTYWQAYAEAMAHFHPGWTRDDIPLEVHGKMGWFAQTIQFDALEERANHGAGLAAVRSGDPGQVAAWLHGQRDPDGAGELLIWAALDRGWRDHAPWIAQIAEPIVGKAGWARAKLDEVAYYRATQGL